MKLSLEIADLSHAWGGMDWSNFRMSDQIEDRRLEPMPWQPRQQQQDPQYELYPELDSPELTPLQVESGINDIPTDPNSNGWTRELPQNYTSYSGQE